MRLIKTYDEFIKEALLPSQFRKYVSEFNKERYADKFKQFKEKYDGDKNAYRIYLPIDVKSEVSENEKNISKFLLENDYTIVDYISGTCRFKDAKNTSKIGQVLTRLKNDNLMKLFVEDPIRKSGKNELLVCISRHPYDIAGADTDRKWTNCMTIGNEKSKRIEELELLYKKTLDSSIRDKIKDIKKDGANIRYLIHDVKEGSLIAYLINADDRDIKNPIANLNIKPFINDKDENDIVLISDSKMYGNGNDEFKKVVDNFLNEFNEGKAGIYRLKDMLYNDNPGNVFLLNADKMDTETVLKYHGIKNYTIVDGLVNVDDNVYLNYHNLSKLPVKFGKVTGYFSCTNNNLTSLEGCPTYVGNTFNCGYNQITSLEYGPTYVGSCYYCTHNLLTDLKGCPDKVEGSFYCGVNNIYSLEGLTNIKIGDIYRNPIYSLFYFLDLKNDKEKREYFIKCDIIKEPEYEGGLPIIVKANMDKFTEKFGYIEFKGDENYKLI